MENKIEIRPWGYFEILSDQLGRKIKKLVIKPNQKISLQSHKLREEFWLIESGKGIVTLDEHEGMMFKGNFIHIPKKSKHRIWNHDSKDDLVILEVAYGLCDEKDIVRYDDIYNRIK